MVFLVVESGIDFYDLLILHQIVCSMKLEHFLMLLYPNAYPNVGAR